MGASGSAPVKPVCDSLTSSLQQIPQITLQLRTPDQLPKGKNNYCSICFQTPRNASMVLVSDPNAEYDILLCLRHTLCQQCRRSFYKEKTVSRFEDAMEKKFIAKSVSTDFSLMFTCNSCTLDNLKEITSAKTFQTKPHQDCLWPTLPAEIQKLIFSFLTLNQRQQLRRVSQTFYHFLTKNSPGVPTVLKTTVSNFDEKRTPAQRDIFGEVWFTLGLQQNTDQVGVVLRDDKRYRFFPGINYDLESSCMKFDADERCPIGYQFLSPVAINGYGMTKGLSRLVYHTPRYRHSYVGCWNDQAKIKAYDGSYIEAKDIREGDVLYAANGSPTIVDTVVITPKNCITRMVAVGDFFLTPGHPVFHNGDWYRPDEIWPIQNIYMGLLYDFHCTPETSLVVGQSENWICASLGSYCPRLAQRDPYSDALYGSGWGTERAKRYEWLLSLKERIPDELVEEATDRYWATVGASCPSLTTNI